MKRKETENNTLEKQKELRKLKVNRSNLLKKSNIMLFVALGFLMVVVLISMIILRLNFYAEPYKGDGNIKEKDYYVDSFKELTIYGPMHVELSQDTFFMLQIYADSNLFDYIKIDQLESSLKISTTQNISSTNITVKLTTDTLHTIELNAGARLSTITMLYSPSIHINVEAGSKADISGIFEKTNINVNAGSELTISGKTDQATYKINAGSRLYADKFETAFCNIETNVGTISHIYVTTELSASSNAGSSIKYRGKPDISKISTSTGGSIERY